MGEHEAQQQLQEGAGSQFDSELVDIFLNTVRNQLPKAA